MFQYLDELSNEMFLHQVVNSSTHKDGNILDLLFTNNQDSIHDILIAPTINSISHHSRIEILTEIDVPLQAESSLPPLTSFRALNFFEESIDWNELTEYLLNVDWKNELRKCDESEMLNCFYSICLEAAKRFVPSKSISKISENKTMRFRTKLLRRRRRINKRLVKSQSQKKMDNLIKELISIEKTLQKSYEKEEDYAEKKALDAIRVNPKFFFSYVKKKSKTKIGPIHNGQSLTNDSKEMAELLSSQYKKVFSTPKPYANSNPNSRSRQKTSKQQGGKMFLTNQSIF